MRQLGAFQITSFAPSSLLCTYLEPTDFIDINHRFTARYAFALRMSFSEVFLTFRLDFLTFFLSLRNLPAEASVTERL